MKWIIRIGVLLVVIVVLLGVIGVIAINKITKTGIERGGTYAMGVETKLSDISVGLLSGSVSLDGLAIDNPEGFKSDHFFQLGDGSVAVTLGSLMEDTVEIQSLKLNNIDMALEKDGGKANYEVILEHLAEVTGGGDEPAEPTEDEAEGKKFIVRELVITDVKVKAEVIGGMSVPIVIPEIKMTDVGSDGEGVTLGDLTGIIMTTIMASVVESAGDLLPEGIGEGLQGGLAAVGDLGSFGVEVVGDVSAMAGEVAGQAAEALGEGAEKLGESAGEVGEKAGEAVDKIGEGLGGLLGGKKEEKAKE